MRGNKRETFWFLQEKVICWKFEELISGIQVLQFLYCKNLTSLSPVWSRQAVPHCFSLSSHLVVGTDGDIIERFGSGAVVPWQGAEVPTRLQSLKHLGPPCPHSHGCCFFQYPWISRVTEQERLRFRWGHAFSPSPLEMFLESGAGVFKGNSLGPRSGPWPHVAEWRWAQCRPVVGPVHGG